MFELHEGRRAEVAAHRVVMRREHHAASRVEREVLEARVRHRVPVERRRASAELIQRDNGVAGRGAEDHGRLGALDQEGGLAGVDPVAGAAQPCEHGVRRAQHTAVRGDRRAHLRQDHGDARRAQQRRLAAHVWTS